MKKGIIVLLITVLVAGMAFAGLTGSADVKGNLDLNALKAKDSALAIANDSEITVDFGIADLAVAPAALEDGAAPAISVDFSAAFTFKVDKDGETAADAKISKASIKGANWEVSILGSADAFNYASMYGYNAASNYAKNPGVTVTYDGFTLGLGYSTKGTWNASLETKAFEVANGLTVQGGVSYSATAAAPEYGYYFTTGGYTKYKTDFKKNADGSYNSGATGSYEASYYKWSDSSNKWETEVATTKTLAELQIALDAAQSAYKAAYIAYVAAPEDENLYKDLKAKTTALAYAKKNLAIAEYGVKSYYYDSTTYEYVDEDGFVQTATVWGGLHAYEGNTAYGNIGDDAISELGASVKVNYASDMLNAGVAADLVFDFIHTTESTHLKEIPTIVADVKASASFKGAGLDVYYSNKATESVSGYDYEVPHVLNAQLTFDVNKFVELPVTVSGSVGMENILGKDTGNGIRVRVLKTSLSAGYDAFALSASFNYGLVAKDIELAGELSYAHEIATAKVGGSFKTVKVVVGAGDSSQYGYVNQLGMHVSLENTSLIPGATLGLAWSADDLTSVNSDVDNKIGIVTASCSIAF